MPATRHIELVARLVGQHNGGAGRGAECDAGTARTREVVAHDLHGLVQAHVIRGPARLRHPHRWAAGVDVGDVLRGSVVGDLVVQRWG